MAKDNDHDEVKTAIHYTVSFLLPYCSQLHQLALCVRIWTLHHKADEGVVHCI
jgi:hypothetical protein